MLKHFWDDDGGFYFTADDAEEILVRQKETYDGAVPAGNSVAMLNLLRLSRITSDTELEGQASELVKAFSVQVKARPSAYTQLLGAVDFAVGPAYEVVIAGDLAAADTAALLAGLRREFVPNKVVLLRPNGAKADDIIRLAPFTKFQTSRNDKATAYVCRNYACEEPTNDGKKMLELLGVKRQQR